VSYVPFHALQIRNTVFRYPTVTSQWPSGIWIEIIPCGLNHSLYGAGDRLTSPVRQVSGD